MTKNFNILFYIRRDKVDNEGNAPIYCRITVDGKRNELAIKRQVAIKKWDSAKGCVNGTNEESKNINAYIHSVRSQIYQHQKLLMDAGKPITAESIKNSFLGISQKSKSLFSLFEEHNGKVKQLIGKDYSDGTFKRYETVLKHLREFVKDRYQLTEIYVSNVDHDFIQEFDHFLRTVHNCANNTAVKYLKNFKKIIRDALAKGLITIDPFLKFKTKLKKIDRGFLTQEELDTIRNKHFIIPRINQIRDIFLFQCYTGLSYADVKKLTSSSLITAPDGEIWISTIRTKTNTIVKVPLLPDAVAILNKYKDFPECENKDVLLPVLSNQKMNAYLKEVADICGISKKITSHLARHTFATTVTLAKGVSLEVVSKMLGHTNLNTSRIYARMVDSRVADEMKSLRSRMVNESLKVA